MSSSDRYARQIAVPGVGEAGHRRIRSADVEVRGCDLAAEVCALYLAGAGVRRLAVSPELLPALRGVNSEVELLERRLEGSIVIEPEAQAADPVLAGSRAARRVLAQVLGGDA